MLKLQDLPHEDRLEQEFVLQRAMASMAPGTVLFHGVLCGRTNWFSFAAGDTVSINNKDLHLQNNLQI